MSKKQKSVDKEFKLSSWAIDNKTIIYVVIAVILFLGGKAYYNLPRETFPEVKETKIYISTPYPGNTAEDIERLIVDPLEDRLKNVSNVVEITSTSQEDYGIITVEFDEKISVEDAKQKVKDEVDAEKAGEDWPTFNGAKVEPNVFDLNFSEETPISNINISGNYPTEKLKEFAEYLQDKIEDLPEIKQADIRGAQEKEVEVAVDIYKMMAAKVSFDDIINAIRNGNMTVSAGNVISSGQRRTIRVIGEIERPEDLTNFVVKTQGGSVYLKDVASIKFQEEERTTYAREFGQGVVMLDVKKRAGRNMVEAAQQVEKIVADAKADVFPTDVKVTIANDQSTKTINQVDDLVNNIIFGIILVVTVLMFFLGFRNALFVGFAIPMSMFMSFMILSLLGYTMNTMILFALIMGLGMLVDNGIVVVENVYRLMEEEGMSRIKAAKKGIGEIAFPIIISTATTVAAFVPLGMWPGVMGEFMIYFPITLSIVLGSSLFVAIFINSMMVSQFMETDDRILSKKSLWLLTAILGGIGLLILALGGAVRGLGSLMIFTVFLFWIYKYVVKGWANRFQRNFLPWLENSYKRFLEFALTGWKPFVFVGGTFLLLFIIFGLFGASIGSQRTSVEFFPDNKPNQIMVYIEYPQGTDIEKTNTITKDIEKRVYAVLNDKQYIEGKDYNFMVESAVSQVGEGAGNPFTDGGSSAEMPHRGKITATLREFKFREGKDSEILRKKVQDTLKGIYPGVTISVEKDPVGPPVGYPINIELEGDDYDELIQTAELMRNYINSRNIAGIDELKIDVNKGKPAMQVSVDRKKSGDLGIAAGQVGNQLRRSIFGEKAGIYKKDGDDYDIYVRFEEGLKDDKSALFNQNITFRDQATGQLKEVPLSAVTSRKNTSSFSAIKHRDNKRVVTVYSALEPGYTDAGAIVSQIQTEMANFTELPKGVSVDYTGQIEEQNKQMAFLMGAFFSGLGLIMFLLIFQFSSISKPAIIMLAIFLSFIGVFGGILVTGASFVIMMTMMGIISLAGIVVNNGVVLLDYTQLLIDRRMVELKMDDHDLLPKQEVKQLIIRAGKARLRPVLLTAITTVLGLIPLAIGFNMDFFSLFNDFNPKIYIGGDNVIFWGPLAWAVIYGLIIATFLTLIIVPVLFYMVHRSRLRIRKWFGKTTPEVKNPELSQAS
ncbi:MAG TPA: efflux RND transporter permease subunit [Flavobacteriaceae bacterium]|nr:efflux RND transporter permease subunit [Flavobacteriaceae bacterium]MCB9212201.1 efflux RND transporter permease subunit [Alteromonas sp.]HPF10421.1 efflux RND transporter permease subunit [Flavobacteriaceae bacterium]HQU20485.1 efflux RND transporter permease subunit [Flavobacteriaceae bacterium]HQU64632.1 efflux RND transporter permease subunit [Flavobacteriaceae bacterium]